MGGDNNARVLFYAVCNKFSCELSVNNKQTKKVNKQTNKQQHTNNILVPNWNNDG